MLIDMIRSAYVCRGTTRQQADDSKAPDNLLGAVEDLTPVVPTNQTVFDNCE